MRHIIRSSVRDVCAFCWVEFLVWNFVSSKKGIVVGNVFGFTNRSVRHAWLTSWRRRRELVHLGTEKNMQQIKLYTREAAAIVFKIFRSITLQENTWTTRTRERKILKTIAAASLVYVCLPKTRNKIVETTIFTYRRVVKLCVKAAAFMYVTFWHVPIQVRLLFECGLHVHVWQCLESAKLVNTAWRMYRKNLTSLACKRVKFRLG